MSSVALDKFGEVLMRRVRDEAITDWKMIVEGKMVADDAEREKLNVLGDEGRKVFVSLVPNVVNTVLHHLLWTLEQSKEITVGIRVGSEQITSVRDVSDGLAGELYSEDGWIARFSKE